MQLDFTNVGTIKSGSIKTAALTVFCGGNNTGKTYAMYALYGALNRRFGVAGKIIKQAADQLAENGSAELDLDSIQAASVSALSHASTALTQALPDIFNTTKDVFKDASIRLQATERRPDGKALGDRILKGKEFQMLTPVLEKGGTKILLSAKTKNAPSASFMPEIANIVWHSLFAGEAISAFLLPAERAGLNLFFRELYDNRARLYRHLSQEKVNANALLKELFTAPYAEPIQDYLDFLIAQRDMRGQVGELADLATDLAHKLLKATYQIDRNGDVSVKLWRSRTRMGLHLASSTLKNLFGLWAYLNHVGVRNECLMIDEPEINLHPDNQRLLARLVARLVNRGVHVVVSTHSDYFVRELNNLIMLSTPFQGRDQIAAEFDYDVDGEALDASKVAAYYFDAKTVSPMEVTPLTGIRADTFDKVINRLNQAASEIYFAKVESLAGDAQPSIPRKRVVRKAKESQ